MLNCSYDGEDLYLDEDTSICYKNCSDNSNSNKYIYQNICVSQCPINYYLEINNTCVFRELLTDININEEEKEEEEEKEDEDEINIEEYLEISEKIDEMNIIIEEEENKNEEIEEKEKENNNKNEDYEENAEYDKEVNEHEIDDVFSSLKYIEIIE